MVTLAAARPWPRAAAPSPRGGAAGAVPPPLPLLPGRVAGGRRYPGGRVRRGAAAGAVEVLEPGSWCALLINLSRRPDRRARLLHLLALANGPLLRRLERVQAVDGRHLAFDDLRVQGAVSPQAISRARRAQRLRHYTIVHNGRGDLVHFDDHLTLGGVACALSHRKALQRIARHPTAQWGLVLEDDVRAAVPRADLAIARLLRKLPKDWAAVCLGYHHAIGKPHASASAPAGHLGLLSLRGADVHVLPARGAVYGLGAWMVRKEAARFLLDHAFPISRQVDYSLTSCLHRADRGLYVLNEESMLFYAPSSEEGMDSDVQTMSSLGRVERRHSSLQDYLLDLSGVSPDSYYDDLFYGDYLEDSGPDEHDWRYWRVFCEEEEMWAEHERELEKAHQQRSRRRFRRS